MVGTVAEIWRYPVKSLAGEQLDSCTISPTGLEADRRWAFVDGTANRAGKLFTATEDKQLMTYRARLQGGRVEVLTPEGEARQLDGELVAAIAQATRRPLTLRDIAGANFDDSPVLIVNMASVAAFALEAGVAVDRRRFRANLYVDGFEPEEEARWIGSRLRVGSAELEVVKPCERCVVITHDPDTTETSPALLRVLTKTSDANMGVYCRVLRPGVVAVGDLIGPE